MLKPRLKNPKLCLFFSLPLLVALGMDVYIWLFGGIGFHFAEIGYLIQHYTPWLGKIVNALPYPEWREFLQVLFETKAVLVGLMIALPPVLWINRPRRTEPKPFSQPSRR